MSEGFWLAVGDAAKRAVDVVLSLFALVLLIPIIAVVAIAVKLSSRGPIIYRQKRVGRHGEEFSILKFRSMRTSSDGLSVTAAGDSRITSIGRFIRKYRLDEIPQLLNIIRGEMSLVGPRPEVPQYVQLYPPEARRVILSVRPGLTDPATIRFRGEQEILASYPDTERAYRDVILPMKIELYVDYVRHRAFGSDIALIFKTVWAVLFS